MSYDFAHYFTSINSAVAHARMLLHTTEHSDKKFVVCNVKHPKYPNASVALIATTEYVLYRQYVTRYPFIMLYKDGKLITVDKDRNHISKEIS